MLQFSPILSCRRWFEVFLRCLYYVMSCVRPQLVGDCFHPKWAVDSRYSWNVHCFQIRWRNHRTAGIGIEKQLTAAADKNIINQQHSHHTSWTERGGGCVYPGEGTHTRGHGREVPQRWPPFLRFSIQLGPYFIPHHDLINPPLSTEKNGLSLSHLVPEIIEQFWNIFFYQFSPWSSIQLTPFTLILDHFDSSF